ncbi:MAG: nicotinate phosphoribosyltransferase [Planctomycetota bacterium]
MSQALLTDLYQLTMASAYWSSGLQDREACFHMFFRRAPFGGAYAIACGFDRFVEWLEDYQFDEQDVAYAAGLGHFPAEFLDHLRRLRMRCQVDAVAEGTVVFPNEPVVRVQGSIIEAQLIETALLHFVNFPTLVATKASRVRTAAQGDTVLEFGMRRAQGGDGALAASRAAWIGGCDATSNLLAGEEYGVPVRGTHAHSWVLCFEEELDAFEAFARSMPHNCVLLVDTYDTMRGVQHAIEVGHRLRAEGHELIGIRLDSGDLLSLSRQARAALDAAGLPETRIVASSDLDEHRVAELKAAGAPISVWGVGTRLVTAHDDPALTGVYKLSAVRERGTAWKPRMKLSEDTSKASDPGVLQVRRRPGFGGDVVFDVDLGCAAIGRDLLEPLFANGERARPMPDARRARARAEEELAALPDEFRALDPTRPYPVQRDPLLLERIETLTAEARA